MARPDPASVLRALQREQAWLADTRAPEIARLRLDRPDLSADEAAGLYARACTRLGPRGIAAAAAGRPVPGSDPPYAEILDWIDPVRPRAGEVTSDSTPETIESVLEPATPRRRGRPGWTREDFHARWREACAVAGEGATYRAVAEHFKTLDSTVGTIDPGYLGRLFRKFRPLDPK